MKTDCSISGLLCEYLENPAGIDTDRPRFFWHTEAGARGFKTSAYRLFVSTSEDNCAADEADIWDSGRIEDADPAGIEYGGPALEAFTRYVWRVQVWDNAGTLCAESETASFVTGVLSQKDWKARWIGTDGAVRYSSAESPSHIPHIYEYYAAYFNAVFSAEQEIEEVRSAYAVVGARGVYELYVNGEKIGDRFLDPAQSQFEKRTLYSMYDITAHLKDRNGVGLVLGNGRYLEAYGYDVPAVIAQIIVNYKDGSRQVFGSGSAWKSGCGPLKENGFYYGECYDAREELKEFGTAGFSLPASWKESLEKDGRPPVFQRTEPIRLIEEFRPLRMHRSAAGSYVFDFGRNISGICELTVQGPAGREVTMVHAELLHPDGTLNMKPTRRARAVDQYILKGQGREVYRPRFTYHGFRYVEVRGYPGVPTLETIKAFLISTDTEKAGDFICSNDLLNAVHRNTCLGQRSNLTGIPTDCPQRDERMGWLGDAQLVCEEAVYNLRMPAFYTKYIADIVDGQREDGALSDVMPTFWKLFPADPAWGTALPILVWNMYWFYGDTRLLEQYHDAVRKYVDFLEGESDNHIIRNLGKYGDWCPPGSILPKRTPLELTSTWYYYHDTLLFSRMAAVLSRDKEAQEYLERAETIKRRFNEEFLADYGYAIIKMAPHDKTPSQTSNALPLYLDMVPGDKKDFIAGKLMESIEKHQDFHVDTGIVGTRYLFDVLVSLGQDEAAYKIATRDSYPGWGYMIDEGATVLWERWEKIEGEGMNSQNHIMLGTIDYWYFSTVAGIKCTAAGWKKARIAPHPMGDLTFAAASTATLRGKIAVSWEKDAASFRCTVTVPAGTEALIDLPAADGTPVMREGGAVIFKDGKQDPKLPEGIVSVSANTEDPRENVFTVTAGPGSYEFIIE